MYAKATFALTLAAVANAHILMTNPVPYGASTLNNFPLDASGADFPCKQRAGVYEKGSASNVYPQGSTQQLQFKGTAVHGGGSCQVSVTTDKEPTKNSVWKVIHSIEGGCPARNAVGNIGNDPNSPVPDTYDFTVPKDLPAGEYSLAWTWFNKIGNREMYMNCAPITVTGSGGSASALEALPDMFVANIGNGCSISEGNDLQFPNPGDSVAQENGATNVFAAPQGSCPTGSSKPGPVQPAPEPTKAPVASPTEAPGGVFVPVPTSDVVAPVEPTKPAQPAKPTPPAEAPVKPPTEPKPVTPPADSKPVPSPPTTPPSTPVTPPVTAGQSGPCSTEGAWNCVGGTSFQRCASGAWTALMPVAEGTSCQEGMGDTPKFGVKGGSFSRRAYPIRI